MTCTHHWQTCPEHSTGTDEPPPMSTVLLCVYGGEICKDGTPFDEAHAHNVVQRIIDRLDE